MLYVDKFGSVSVSRRPPQKKRCMEKKVEWAAALDLRFCGAKFKPKPGKRRVILIESMLAYI